MNWQNWFFVGYYAANAIATVAIIGRERKPIEPGTAAVMVVLIGGLAVIGATA